MHVGDPVIIIAYAQMEPAEARGFHPTIVLMHPDNTVREILSGARTDGLGEHPELAED